MHHLLIIIRFLVTGWPREGTLHNATLKIDCRVESVLVPLRQTVQVDCDHGLHWSIQNLHILAQIFSLDIIFLEAKIFLESPCFHFNEM